MFCFLYFSKTKLRFNRVVFFPINLYPENPASSPSTIVKSHSSQSEIFISLIPNAFNACLFPMIFDEKSPKSFVQINSTFITLLLNYKLYLTLLIFQPLFQNLNSRGL